MLQSVKWTSWRGISLFWKPLTCRASKHTVGTCQVPTGLPWNSYRMWFAAGSSQAQSGGPPLPWFIPHPCCPPSPVKTLLHFFPKVTVQNLRRSPWKTKSRNYSSTLTQSRLFENTHVEDLPSISILQITNYLLTSICPSIFRFFGLISSWQRPCADAINLIFQRRKSRAFITHPNSLSYSVSESNLNPGTLTLNPAFSVTHSSCFQAIKHSQPPAQFRYTSGQSLLFFNVVQPTAF